MEKNESSVTQNMIEVSIEYKDPSGNSRTKKKNKFDHQTNISDLKNWISSWKNGVKEYYLEIKDQHHKYVDFDEEYIDDYKPFGTSESLRTTLELIELRLTEEQDNSQNPPIKTPEKSFTGTNPVVADQQCQALTITTNESKHESARIHPLRSPNPVTIGEVESTIQLVKNVNDIQRDQYRTDNSGRDEKKNCYVQIQGDKRNLEGSKKQASVQPKLKILKDIPQAERALWELHIFLVHEVCQNGKRTLYHDDERHFLHEQNSQVAGHTRSSRTDRDQIHPEPVIHRLTDQMFERDGLPLNLKTCVIPQSKTNPTKIRELFCQLTNEYSDKTTYETTRLACLLVKDGNVEWKGLILSNAMIFAKTGENIGDILIYGYNNDLIEKIPARTLKRKIDLNQSSDIVKRPAVAKATKGKVKQADTSSPLPIPNYAPQQSLYVPSQNPSNVGQFPYDCYSNEQTHLQYPNPPELPVHNNQQQLQYSNQSQLPVHNNQQQLQNPNFENGDMEYPQNSCPQQSMTGNFSNYQTSFAVQSISPTSMNNNVQYLSSLPGMNTFGTWSQSDFVQHSNSGNLNDFQQTENSSQQYSNVVDPLEDFNSPI